MKTHNVTVSVTYVPVCTFKIVLSVMAIKNRFPALHKYVLLHLIG